MTLNAERNNHLQTRCITISCVVPVYNEAAGVEAFVAALRQKLQQHSDFFEIILIDDGSTDDTALRLTHLTQHDPAIKALLFSRNFGKENALTAGLEHASGEVTILIDADFQHPVELIDAFLEKWAQGYDMVYAVQENRQNEGFLKRNFTRLFYSLLSATTHTPIPANAGDYRLLDKKVVAALCQLRERGRFMKGLYAWVGFPSIAISFTAPERQSGQSAFHFRKLVELAMTGITAFSDVPLRVWGLMGLIISGIAFAYGLCIIFDTLWSGVDVPGYATIVVGIMFLGGIQLLSIGILGEYIGRIFQEVKKRPPYILREKIGFSATQNDHDNS